MQIQVRKNRFNPNGLEEWSDAEYYIWLGDNVSLEQNPVIQIEYRQNEAIGCLISGFARVIYPEFTGDFHIPAYTNDFIVFKDNKIGREIHAEFLENGDINLILWERRINPSLYLADMVKVHPSLDLQPPILWGSS
jgi:hypothetical protein